MIQGKTKDREITKEGAYLTIENQSILAEMLNENLQNPIKQDNWLREFSSGILAGNTHEYNKENYPKYYNMSSQIDDLDGIHGAEKAEQVQARVIGFLAQYIGKENYSQAIISDPSFMECFINTIQGERRTTPVEVSNGCFQVFENPLDKISIVQRNRAMSSQVYIMDTVDQKYVVKIKDRELNKTDFLEKELLEQLKGKLENLPILLDMSNSVDDQGNKKSVKTIKYIEGKHLYGKLNNQQKRAFLTEVSKLHEVLQSVDASQYPKVDLYEMVKEKTKVAKNPYVMQMGAEILQDKSNIERLQRTPYCLVHDDLNRDNVLFQNKEDGSSQVSIIDWESIKLMPREYQLAVFLASGLLIEGEKAKDIVKVCGEAQSDREFMTYLMKIRLFTGIHFFAENEFSLHENKEEANGILKKYFYAAEKLRGFEKDEENQRQKVRITEPDDKGGKLFEE